MKNQARKPIRPIPTMGPMTTPAIHALLSCGGAGIGVGDVGIGVGVRVDDANHDRSVLCASPSVQERNVPTCWRNHGVRRLNSIIAPKNGTHATGDSGERIRIPIIFIH